MKRAITLAVPTLMLAGSLAACGEDTPAVCGSVDDLKSSIQKIKDIDLTSSGALSDLESGLKAIKSDLDAVASDAKAQFSTQVDTVEASYGKLETSVEAAVATPAAATLAAAGTALSTFGTDAKKLVSDVQSTC